MVNSVAAIVTIYIMLSDINYILGTFTWWALCYRSSDVAGVHNRCRDWWTGLVCQHRWTRWDGRRACLPVCVDSLNL